MKRIYIVAAISILFCSCGNSTNTSDENKSGDTVGLKNPSGIDTVKHPTGVDNSSVISTDTAAMNVQNTINKADSIAKQKNK